VSGAIFAAEALGRFAGDCFVAAGMREEDAIRVADNLILADLRGVESHGVTRVPIYAERLRRGAVAPHGAPRIERGEDKAAALLDGDNAMGAVVGAIAMEHAIARARRHGIGVVAARRSNHFGICADYILQAASAGMVAMVASNTAPSMAVWGAREPALGTNPIAFGFPRGDGPHLVLDMATSVVARGKIVEKAKRGDSIPPGWALDAEGRPTTDAKAAADGVVLPFAGPKGSGLALVVEAFGGVLSGAAIAGGIGNLYGEFDRPQDIGHIFVAMDPDAFIGRDRFAARMAALTSEMKARARAEGVAEIVLPGELEARMTERNRLVGVRLPANVVGDLCREAERARIAPLTAP
jgi:LDH2 family malate/lactate/ureidoglycolate dehydrogenase